jgi:hypothetical protein
MKRSNIFLTVAVLVPIALLWLGLGFGIKQMMPADSGGNRPSASFPRLGDDLALVHEGVQDIRDDIRIDVRAAEFKLRFDPDLKQQARIRVESKTPDLARVEIRSDALEFSPTHGGEPLRINLDLPVTFKLLAAEINASRCQIDSNHPLDLGVFNLSVQASDCELKFGGLTAREIELVTNAGQLQFTADQLSTRRAEIEANAAQLTTKIGKLSFASGTEQEFKVGITTGQGDVSIGDAPEHTLQAAANMGTVTIRRYGESEELSGLGRERTYPGPDAAPRLELKAEMGKLNFSIGN